jgi:aspartyl-tRNA(Asn)/glutamyl-tRNA(Gln) amidotransferase subunit A
MPCGFDAAGMPVGAQLIGPALGEQKLLDAAYAYQQDTDYHKQHPQGGAAQ